MTLPGDRPESPFIGRRGHLAHITQWVGQARASTETKPTVVILHGPIGAGRTALALHAAWQVRAQFRGVCAVNLGGGAVDSEPLTTKKALLCLLEQFSAPRDQLLTRGRLSHDQHVQRLAERYRNHLTGQPMVIIVDDASDPEQVRTLIPERSESLVLVTAADPLDLALPEEWAHNLRVDALDETDAHGLLQELTHNPVPQSDPEATERIIELCGGLPLALRVAGSSLGSRTLRGLADDLEGYGWMGPVERALALRYHEQPEVSRRLLRCLALVGRASLGAAAGAALLATNEGEATRRLDDLATAGLIEHVRDSRYRLHDAVRGFAQARLLDEEEIGERAAAQERLIRTYSVLAESVIQLVEGKTSTRADTSVHGAVGSHGFLSLDQAMRWLDDESSFITATLRGTEGVDKAAVLHLLGALCDYCLLRGDQHRLSEISELAQAVNQGLLVHPVPRHTGIANRQPTEIDHARSDLTSVANQDLEGQNPAGAGRALCSLGITLHHQGNLREAATRLREAVELQSADELRADRAWTLHALAAVLNDQDNVSEALKLLLLALELHGESQNLHGQAWSHMQLGQVYLHVGHIDPAEDALRTAQQEHSATRDNRGTAWTHTHLARARLARGEAAVAVAELNDALTRHRDNEDARGEAWTLYYLGQAQEEAGDTDAALRSLERARTMFSRTPDVYGLACARHHSGRVTRDQRAAHQGSLRNTGFARQLLQDARQDFRKVGVPHSEAWSCIELAVIDAGNGRIPKAMELVEEAGRLFDGIGDRHGQDWARFLRCTLLPLISEESATAARDDIAALLAEGDDDLDPDLAEHAAEWSLILQRGIAPGSPWEAWRLGMTPRRSSREYMALREAAG
ncbi:tetratricopeptide repeat protein [Streptomyces sp. NBC_01474]|nr:tetratricopeptide repeat protein [Streptomyces sp. NBC_01474]WSE01308.1 tetratricopeptide repeat protein [Streptomyces sp. NBC_01474]